VRVTRNDHSVRLLDNPHDMARAVSLLVAGYPPPEQAGYLETLAQIVGTPKATQELVVVEACRDDRRIGVALAQILPGKAALFWPLQAATEDLKRALLTCALEELRRREVVVAQALLDVDDDANFFLQAGFQDAGELVYMLADQSVFPAQAPSGELTIELADPADPELAEVIEATYRGSMDCPLVDGWRDVWDVIEGYRGTGTFRPELWRLVRRGNEAVGCLLMADFPAQAQGELVYLGVRPEFRGRDWGLEITRWGLHEGRKWGWEQVVLAVDMANEPARRLYERAGFEGRIRRRLLIRRLFD